MKLRMVRKGHFTCNWRTRENMCGNPSSYPRYSYICEIECGTILDQHGFMIDQLDVDRYFQKKWNSNVRGYVARSCEKMAIECVKDVKEMVEKHMSEAAGRVEIHRLAVTIYFNDNAAMTAEWRQNESTCGNVNRRPRPKADGRQRAVGKRNPVPRAKVGRSKGSVTRKLGRDKRASRFPFSE